MDRFSLEKSLLEEWVLCLQVSQGLAWEGMEKVSMGPQRTEQDQKQAVRGAEGPHQAASKKWNKTPG